MIFSNLLAVALMKAFLVFFLFCSQCFLLGLFITRLCGVIFSSLHRKCDVSNTLVTVPKKTGAPQELIGILIGLKNTYCASVSLSFIKTEEFLSPWAVKRQWSRVSGTQQKRTPLSSARIIGFYRTQQPY